MWKLVFTVRDKTQRELDVAEGSHESDLLATLIRAGGFWVNAEGGARVFYPWHEIKSVRVENT